MDRDLVVGIAGAALLVAAMIAVFSFEADNASSAGTPFTVAWRTTAENVPGASGNLQADNCEDVPVELAQTNMTAASFTVTWADDVGAADTFNVTVTGPGGAPSKSMEAANGNGGDGEITVAFELGGEPATSQVLADDEDDARAQLAQQNTRTAGQGTWTMTICLVSAPGTSAPVAGLPEVQPDGANSYEWSGSVQTYAGTVRPATTSPGE